MKHNSCGAKGRSPVPEGELLVGSYLEKMARLLASSQADPEVFLGELSFPLCASSTFLCAAERGNNVKFHFVF